MAQWTKFSIGALGGLLPILASLAAIDLAAFSKLIDVGGLTLGMCVGYGLKVVGLFLLGGIFAALNDSVTSPLALVQIGIAAPALVTSYLNAPPLEKPPEHSAFEIVSHAYADERTPHPRYAASFFDEVYKGLNLGQTAHGIGAPPSSDRPAAAPPRPAAVPLDQLPPSEKVGIVDRAKDTCLAVPRSLFSSPAAMEAIYPQNKFAIRDGGCS